MQLPQPTEHIPQGIFDGLCHYMHGIRPGAALYAILAHDAAGVRRWADPDTLACWTSIADYVTAHLPDVAHGSTDAVEWWLADGHKLHAENREAQGVAG